jgi:hypothetical protein
MAIYAVGIAVSALSRWVVLALYVVVAVMWLIPDRRLATDVEEATAPK